MMEFDLFSHHNPTTKRRLFVEVDAIIAMEEDTTSNNGKDISIVQLTLTGGREFSILNLDGTTLDKVLIAKKKGNKNVEQSRKK